MADIDRNNNLRSADEKENKMKKRFTSVKNFFSEIIGKTGSMPLGLDASEVDERIRSEGKRNKRLGSMPSLFRSPHAKSKQQPLSIENEQQHARLTPTMSVPLNLPRAKVVPRSVLSTGSLNQSDVNEDWLKPVRYRSYRESNDSLGFSQSDLSLNSFDVSSQNLTISTLPKTSSSSKQVHNDFNVSKSADNLTNTLPKRSSIANKKHQVGSRSYQGHHRNRVRFSDDDLTRITNKDNNNFAAMKRSLSNSTELKSNSVSVNPDVEDALAALKKLDQNLKTQSKKSRMHVGAFVCSVESSTGNYAEDDYDSVFSKQDSNEIMPSNDDSTARHKTPAITVQIDHDKVFGKSTVKTRPKKPSSYNNDINNDMSRGRRSDAELIKHHSISSDVLHECFDTSFWDDAQALLSTEKIREIAESEARLVVSDFYYGDNKVTKWTKEITCNVRDKIRAYTGRQFKVVVNAFIGSLVPSQQHDTVNIAVRGLTEPISDRFVVSAFEKDDMFISVTCILIRNGSIS